MTLSAALHGATIGRRWTPLELSGLVAWYDASVTTSVTTATGGVSQWDDLSGNGNHATQTTSGNRPDSVTDGIDFVKANGDFLTTAISASSSSRCLLAVVSPDNATHFGPILSTTSNGGLDLQLPYGQANSAGIQRSNQAVLLSTTALSYTAGANLIAGFNVDGTSLLVSANGTEVTGTATPGLTAGLTATLGKYLNTQWFDGIMREVVVASALSQANRQLVEGYLAWKWSLTGLLPADHPYKNIRP